MALYDVKVMIFNDASMSAHSQLMNGLTSLYVKALTLKKRKRK